MRYLGLVLALGVSGCATFNNPISLNQLGAIESGYGLALSTAVAYRSLPLCKTGTISTIAAICAQRSIIVKLQRADKTTQAAIAAANSFVLANPTLDATTLVSAAQSALAGFQAIEAAYNIH